MADYTQKCGTYCLKHLHLFAAALFHTPRFYVFFPVSFACPFVVAVRFHVALRFFLLEIVVEMGEGLLRITDRVGNDLVPIFIFLRNAGERKWESAHVGNQKYNFLVLPFRH